MRKHWFLHLLKFAAFAVIAVVVAGVVVMGLWNWLLPDLFGWHAIGFWQAIGLLVLSRILLGVGRISNSSESSSPTATHPSASCHHRPSAAGSRASTITCSHSSVMSRAS